MTAVWHFTKNKWLQIAVQCARTRRMRNGSDYSKHVAARTRTPAHLHTCTNTHRVPLRITPAGMPEALPTGMKTRVRQTESIAWSCFQHSNTLIILMLPALPKLIQWENLIYHSKTWNLYTEYDPAFLRKGVRAYLLWIKREVTRISNKQQKMMPIYTWASFNHIITFANFLIALQSIDYLIHNWLS